MIKKNKKSKNVLQKKKQLRRHRQSVFFVSMVLFLMVSIVFAKSISLHGQNQEYVMQAQELQGQIDKEKERSKEISNMKKHIESDEYVKEMAEDRLGLVSPNEILFRPVE